MSGKLSFRAVNFWRVMLSCQHVKTLGGEVRPFAGLDVWCWWCSLDVTVTAVLDEYKARCQTCSFSRSYGSDRYAGMRSAGKHHAETGHRVILRCDGAAVVTYERASEQGSLFDAPPY